MNTTPTLIQLDPKLLTTGKNVRASLNLDKDFLSSVRLHGVRQPIEAFPDPLIDGSYQIHTGHRRTAAALAAELDSVPVLVITAREAADRIVEQLGENIHRLELSPAEIMQGYSELSLFGLSAMVISKKTSTKLARVGDALKVSKVPDAVAALEHYQLTIDDALAFAEFDGDADSIAILNQVATHQPSQLAHQVQRLRDARARANDGETITAGFAAAGIPVIGKPNYDTKTARRADQLFTTAKLGAVVPLETILAEAGDDLRGFIGDTWIDGRYVAEAGYAVVNWTNHGWHTDSYGTTDSKGPLTDEDKAARTLARQNNIAWVASTQVRRAWITELLTRRSLPSDAVNLAAVYFAALPSDYGSKLRALAHELLGAALIETPLSYGGTRSISALPALVKDSPIQSTHVLVAIAVAGIELSVDEKKGWDTNEAQYALYLHQLSNWGYTLSDLEESIVTRFATKTNPAA